MAKKKYSVFDAYQNKEIWYDNFEDAKDAHERLHGISFGKWKSKKY